MSRYMTEEEIAAEQELIRQQAVSQQFNFVQAAETATKISDEAADAVSPFDLLHSSNYTTKQIRSKRFDICKGCDRLFQPTKSCKECGCFMAAKTWLKDADCPLGKWIAHEIDG